MPTVNRASRQAGARIASLVDPPVQIEEFVFGVRMRSIQAPFDDTDAFPKGQEK
jgi:hypothetical protein